MRTFAARHFHATLFYSDEVMAEEIMFDAAAVATPFTPTTMPPHAVASHILLLAVALREVI